MVHISPLAHHDTWAQVWRYVDPPGVDVSCTCSAMPGRNRRPTTKLRVLDETNSNMSRLISCICYGGNVL